MAGSRAAESAGVCFQLLLRWGLPMNCARCRHQDVTGDFARGVIAARPACLLSPACLRPAMTIAAGRTKRPAPPESYNSRSRATKRREEGSESLALLASSHASCQARPRSQAAERICSDSRARFEVMSCRFVSSSFPCLP